MSILMCLFIHGKIFVTFFGILSGPCFAEKSVHCDLDKKVKVGKVVCAVCGEEWCVAISMVE
jgi:transcription elongation factor Elf1